MDKYAILLELSELLNIPQIERLLAHKIVELKEYYADEIAIYFELKKTFRQEAYGKMHTCQDQTGPGEEGGGAPKISQTYMFEIDMMKNRQWRIHNIQPAPPTGTTSRDIIPQFIIDYMVSLSVNSTKIETVNHFSHPNLSEKAYNLRFARYSEYHFLGSITEIQNSTNTSSQLVKANKFNNIITLHDSYKTKNDELNYLELIQYLEKYPAFRTHILSEFFMKWKPLIEWNLLKVK